MIIKLHKNKKINIINTLFEFVDMKFHLKIELVNFIEYFNIKLLLAYQYHLYQKNLEAFQQ